MGFGDSVGKFLPGRAYIPYIHNPEDDHIKVHVHIGDLTQSNIAALSTPVFPRADGSPAVLGSLVSRATGAALAKVDHGQHDTKRLLGPGHYVWGHDSHSVSPAKWYTQASRARDDTADPAKYGGDASAPPLDVHTPGALTLDTVLPIGWRKALMSRPGRMAFAQFVLRDLAVRVPPLPNTTCTLVGEGLGPLGPNGSPTNVWHRVVVRNDDPTAPPGAADAATPFSYVFVNRHLAGSEALEIEFAPDGTRVKGLGEMDSAGPHLLAILLAQYPWAPPGGRISVHLGSTDTDALAWYSVFLVKRSLTTPGPQTVHVYLDAPENKATIIAKSKGGAGSGAGAGAGSPMPVTPMATTMDAGDTSTGSPFGQFTPTSDNVALGTYLSPVQAGPGSGPGARAPWRYLYINAFVDWTQRVYTGPVSENTTPEVAALMNVLFSMATTMGTDFTIKVDQSSFNTAFGSKDNIFCVNTESVRTEVETRPGLAPEIRLELDHTLWTNKTWPGAKRCRAPRPTFDFRATGCQALFFLGLCVNERETEDAFRKSPLRFGFMPVEGRGKFSAWPINAKTEPKVHAAPAEIAEPRSPVSGGAMVMVSPCKTESPLRMETSGGMELCTDTTTTTTTTTTTDTGVGMSAGAGAGAGADAGVCDGIMDRLPLLNDTLKDEDEDGDDIVVPPLPKIARRD